VIELSFEKFFQSKNEVKLGFLGCIWNTKDQGSRVKELKKQSMIKLSFKFFFQSMNEVRVLGKNLGHQGFGALEGIKRQENSEDRVRSSFFSRSFSI